MKNQDIDILTRIFWTMQDIKSLQHRSEFHDEQLYSITRRLTGMPGGGGMPHGFDSLIGELEEINQAYGKQVEAYVADLRKAEKILNGIENPNMKTFVRMLYVDQIAQAEIMRELEMTEYQFDKARKSIEEAESMKKVRWPEKFRPGSDAVSEKSEK